jgi:hypothetical protein
MKIIGEFNVTLVKKRTLDEIVAGSGYDEINPLVKVALERQRLPIQDPSISQRTIGLMEVEDLIESHDVLARAAEMGWTRPSVEDAFLLGEQCSQAQKEGKIVFLCEPPYVWSGHSFQLMLDFDRSKGRIITLVSSGNRWHNGYRFALRKK